MQIEKYIFLFIGFLLLGCQIEEDSKEGERERNIVKESLDKTILKREEMGFIGKVRSTLEYEFDSDKWKDKTIKIKGSKYSSISSDDLIEEIRDVTIRESNSYLFDKSGKLINDIRFVEYDEIYMEVVETYKFDSEEKLIEWTRSEFDGKLDTQKLFIYDSKERLVEFQKFHFYDLLVSKINVSYFQDTIQFKEVTTKGRDTTSSWIAKYNKYGELIENDPNALKKFDSRGNLVRVRYEMLGKVIPSFSVNYDYDSRNNKVRETEYDSLNNVVETKMFYYNEKDELIQEIEIDSIGTEIKRFDESGYVFEYTSIPFEEEEYSFYGYWRNFDKYGNVTKTVDINKDEKGKLVERITRTELEYDEIGNWISKRVYQNDSLTTMFERKIKYY